MSVFALMGTPGQLAKVIDYLEANGVQINNLADLDATISSRAPASTALSTAVWTSARAGMSLQGSLAGRFSLPAAEAGPPAL